jgi:manganese/zinc/iron transport system substrate-binding protein
MRPRPMARNLVGCLAAAVLVAGCAGGGGAVDPDAPAGPIQVVATTGMIADMARRVAGEHAEVHSLMAPGVDPHLYKASESDVRRLDRADLVLYNGFHLEGKMADILEKMGRNKPVVAVAEAAPPDRLRRPPAFEGLVDPHLWFDVDLWSHTIAPIVEQMVALVPEHADEIRANGTALEAELLELDAWVGDRVAELPQQQRVLVTAHDAFGYFGTRYGFEVMGLQGLSTATEAGLSDVDRVVDTVLQRQLKAMFVESSVPAKSIEAVQAACEDRGHSVAIGGELFSDSMGTADSPEGSYTGMVRHNVHTVVEALR